ncbi:AraC family transcriptional regulator, partial [Streptococcus pyogenes]
EEGYEEIKTAIFAIFDTIRKQESYYELLLKSRLLDLLYLLYQYGYIVKKNTDDLYRKNEKLRGLIDHIHQHYQEN